MRWLSRHWKVSRKGNEWSKADGYIVTIFRRGLTWVASVKAEDESFDQFLRRSCRTPEAAKLAAFDRITELLSAAATSAGDA